MLRKQVLHANEQCKKEGLNYDPFLRESLITTIATTLRLKLDYIRENIGFTEDVKSFAIDQGTQRHIDSSSMVSFDLNGLSFVASWKYGRYVLHLNYKDSLIEVRTPLDLVPFVENDEEASDES